MKVAKIILTSLLVLFLPDANVLAATCENTTTVTCYDIVAVVRNMKPPVVMLYYDMALVYRWIFNGRTPKYMVNPKYKTYKDIDIFDIKGKNYIFFVDDLKQLITSISYLKNINKLSTDTKYLVNYQNSVPETEIHDTFLFLLSLNIYKSIVHTKEDKLLSYYPYDPENKCGFNVNPVEGFRGAPFDNRVPQNLNGCPVTISWNMHAIFMWNPFSDTFPGSLFIAINTIGQIMNFTPLYLKNNSDFLVDFLKTGTFETAERDVEERNIDLILYGSDNGEYVHLSNLQDMVKSISFSILIPSRKRIKYNFYFNIFRYKFLLITVAVVILVIYLWKRLTKQSYGDSVFNVYRVMIQLTVPKFTSYFPARMVFSSFLWFIFLTDIKYSSYLSSVYTSPGKVKKLGYVNQFQTTTPVDLKHNRVRRFLYFSGLNNSLGRTSDNTWVLLPDAVNPEAEIEDFLITDSHSSYVHTHQRQKSTKKISRVQVSSERKMSGIEYKIASKRGFPMVRKINYWIEAILQSGLLQKWTADQSKLLRKVIIEKPGVIFKTKLRMEHLRGAFITLLVGYVISTIAFIVESYIFRNGYYRDYLH